MTSPASTIGDAKTLDVPSPPPPSKAAPILGLTIVLPAYNEADAVAQQVESIRAVMAPATQPWEILVVDDGSSDGTGPIAEKAGARVITNPQNAGYGASLKRGITHARYEHIIICDADGTYPVKRIPDLIAEAEKGFDMVVGARTGPYYRGSLLKHPWRLVYLELCRFTTGVKIPDANSGLRLFRKQLALDVYDDLCPGYSFTTTLTLATLSRGAFVRFYPIEYGARIGKSKVRFLIDALRTAQLVCQAILLYNPLKLFLLMSVAPALAAVALLVLAIAWRSETLVVAAVVSAATVLLTFCAGLLADLLRKVASKR